MKSGIFELVSKLSTFHQVWSKGCVGGSLKNWKGYVLPVSCRVILFNVHIYEGVHFNIMRKDTICSKKRRPAHHENGFIHSSPVPRGPKWPFGKSGVYQNAVRSHDVMASHHGPGFCIRSLKLGKNIVNHVSADFSCDRFDPCSMGVRYYWSLARICKKTSDILHFNLSPPVDWTIPKTNL